MTASSNPWSQECKLATGKVRSNSIMNKLRKPNSSEATGDDNFNMLDHLITDDREEEEISYHKKHKENDTETNSCL